MGDDGKRGVLLKTSKAAFNNLFEVFGGKRQLERACVRRA